MILQYSEYVLMEIYFDIDTFIKVSVQENLKSLWYTHTENIPV